jgi:hypothetical protein
VRAGDIIWIPFLSDPQCGGSHLRPRIATMTPSGLAAVCEETSHVIRQSHQTLNELVKALAEVRESVFRTKQCMNETREFLADISDREQLPVR